MEEKNKRLRESLTTMGINVMEVQPGSVTVVENRDVEYRKSHQ